MVDLQRIQILAEVLWEQMIALLLALKALAVSDGRLLTLVIFECRLAD